MKVAQLLATIPDALPPEYAGELQAAEPGAADGLGLRQAAHEGRARRRLAEEIRRASSISRPRRLRSARCIARRRIDGARAGLQAAISRHAVGGRGRSAASSACCSPSAGASIRRSTPARSPRRSARGCARSSTTRARPKHVALYRAMLADEDAIRVPQRVARTVDRPAADARLARGRPDAGRTRTTRSAIAQPARHRDVHAPGGCRSAASASSTAIRISAITRCSTEDGAARRHQSARLRLHPHLPAAFVGGVVDLYRGLRDDDDARVVHAYETWGFKRLTRELIDILNIWARFIYGPLLDDRVRTHRRRREARRIWPQAGLPGASGAARSKGR